MAQKLDRSHELVFTAACVGGKAGYYGPSRDTQCCLLFGRNPGDLDLHEKRYHKEIATSEVVRRYLGNTFMILPFENTHQRYWGGTKYPPSLCLIATNKADKVCRKALYASKNLPVTTVTNGEITYTDGNGVLDMCGLPDKYVVGCIECPSDTKILNICPLIKLNGVNDVPEFDIETYMEDAKYWKTKIGDFVAIGPSLTSNDAVPQAPRTIEAHNFKDVQNSLDQRSAASTERVRLRKFQTTVCPMCAMRKSCEQEGALKYCGGCYEGSQHSLARKIVKKTNIPFSGPQLRTLLLNSGLLDRYVHRRKCYATLHTHNGDMRFMIHAKRLPGRAILTTQNYKTACEWLKKYKNNVIFPTDTKPMYESEKAALIELSSKNYSPTYRNGWRKTSYARLSIATTCLNGSFDATYSWGGSHILPWELSIRTLEDIYTNYGTLLGVDRTHHLLCYS